MTLDQNTHNSNIYFLRRHLKFVKQSVLSNEMIKNHAKFILQILATQIMDWTLQFYTSLIFYSFFSTYNHGKNDKDPYNISTMEMGSL